MEKSNASNHSSSNKNLLQSFGNHYAKNNPTFLQSMFGKTDIMPLWIADMDFKVAEPITKELQRLIDRANFAYEFNSEQVFDALANWNKKRHGLTLKSTSFLQVSGVLTGLGLLIRELTNESDSVMIQTPVYHQFFKVIETAKRKVVENPLKIVNGNYQMDFENMEEQFKTKKIKVILLCNPHNPVGRVWRKDELQQLILLANTYNVRIISDEIHSEIVYTNATFNSITAFDNTAQHITVIGSPAKTFGMQSIANGYLYIPDKKTHQQVKDTITSLYLDHGNTLSSYATLAAYTCGEKWVNETVAYLEKTVNWIADYLQKELPKIKLIQPEGTYLVWLDCSALHLSPEELNRLMVDSANLALAPGTWFGNKDSQFMRMTIASPLEKIQQAFYQIKTAVATINKQ